MKIEVGNVSSKIIIGGKDNLLKDNLHKSLRDYLRERPLGYSQVAAYRRKQWDGYRYFLNQYGEFATGFLEPVIRYAHSLGAEIEIEDKRGELPMLYQELEWKMPNGWEVFPEQQELVQKVEYYVENKGMFTVIGKGAVDLYFPRGIIDAATNAGKNSIMAGVHMNVHEAKTLFLINLSDVYQQALKFFSMFGEVGEVNSKKIKFGTFTIAMAKTLLNRAEESINVRNELSKFNVLLVDETHMAGGNEYAKLLQMIPAPMRVFVSGTPLDNENPVNNLIIIGLSGKKLGTLTNQELIDLGRSQKPTINVYLNPEFKPNSSYEQEYNEVIVQSSARANLIVELVRERQEKKGLISFQITEHGYLMYELLKEKLPHLRVEIAHGKTKDREAIYERYRAGDIDILLASSIMKHGLNIHNIEYLIMGQGGKAKITVKQFVGRVLRHDGKHDEVEVIDFYDIGEHLAKHSRKRIRLYKEQGFEVNLKYEALRLKPVQFREY